MRPEGMRRQRALVPISMGLAILALLSACDDKLPEQVDTTLDDEPTASAIEMPPVEATETGASDQMPVAPDPYQTGLAADAASYDYDQSGNDASFGDLPNSGYAPPAPELRLRPVPRSSVALWVTSNDYPSRALREERAGRVTAVFDVNSAGRVENCRIGISSGSPDLDDVTCTSLTRRGRYLPATDRGGVPVAARDIRESIDWTIPGN